MPLPGLLPQTRRCRPPCRRASRAGQPQGRGAVGGTRSAMGGFMGSKEHWSWAGPQRLPVRQSPRGETEARRGERTHALLPSPQTDLRGQRVPGPSKEGSLNGGQPGGHPLCPCSNGTPRGRAGATPPQCWPSQPRVSQPGPRPCPRAPRSPSGGGSGCSPDYHTQEVAEGGWQFPGTGVLCVHRQTSGETPCAPGAVSPPVTCLLPPAWAGRLLIAAAAAAQGTDGSREGQRGSDAWTPGCTWGVLPLRGPSTTLPEGGEAPGGGRAM